VSWATCVTEVWTTAARKHDRRSSWPALAAMVAICLSTMVAVQPASGATTGAFGWGNNEYGQLGDGTTKGTDVPATVSGLQDVTAVAAGADFSLALLSNGTVMAWGEGGFGQLGNGATNTSHVPEAVSGLSNVIAIAAGGNHALALLSSGRVMAWGYNAFGQLGDGKEGYESSSDVPVAVSGLSEVTGVAAGYNYSMALLRNGTVMSWGLNEGGTLGNGATTQGSYPVPAAVSGLSEVTAIAAGLGGVSTALLKDGKVMDWGYGQYGELGDGADESSAVPVMVSNLSAVVGLPNGGESMALLGNGTVMDWGLNSSGQLGNDGKELDSDVPVAVSYLRGVTAIAGGLEHRLALLGDGKVMAWGNGAGGRLGDGAEAGGEVPVEVSGLDEATAIAAGQYFSLAAVGGAPGRAPSFTWSGQSSVSEEWSLGANWETGLAPMAVTQIGTLAFPRLTSTACTVEEEIHPCYFSFNDVSGLSAEAMQIDDGDDYTIGGDELELGSGGLTASPAAGASGSAGDTLEIPFRLAAPQTWSVSGRPSSAEVGENGVLLAGGVTGAGKAMTVELADLSALYMGGSVEVGPLTFKGADTGEASIFNGFVGLLDGELNGSDGEPVILSHTFFIGSGAVGDLETEDSNLDVGSGSDPEGGLETAGVKLDSHSVVNFAVTGHGAVAGNDYSQLTSRGAIELEGSSIEVEVAPGSKAEREDGVCPVPTPGTTYTFVSTTGTLSGAFVNAPEGGEELPIKFAQACPKAAELIRLTYHESGSTQTVTGTVEAAAKERREVEEHQEAEEHRGARERQEAKELGEAQARREARERQEASELQEAAERREARERDAKKGEEETAAASARKHAEEAAKEGVLAAKEGSPDATIVDRSLQVSSSGAVSIEVGCPAAVSSCVGTVTLTTVGAVGADGARTAKTDAAVARLATGSFTVQGGRVKVVLLRMPVKARILLARLHVMRVRATILAHDPAGGAYAWHAIVMLHAAKRDKD
jgi:alpha-tubulin suppressor-like RCC1 family protein